MVADFWVYILICANDSYYTGYTSDLTKRFAKHQLGKVKYTRGFKPIAIAHVWKINGTKSSAMKIESYIKKLTRIKKEQLIREPQALCTIFEGVTILPQSVSFTF